MKRFDLLLHINIKSEWMNLSLKLFSAYQSANILHWHSHRGWKKWTGALNELLSVWILLLCASKHLFFVIALNFNWVAPFLDFAATWQTYTLIFAWTGIIKSEVGQVNTPSCCFYEVLRVGFERLCRTSLATTRQTRDWRTLYWL